MAQKDSTWNINGHFKGKDILSLHQFTPKDIKKVFTITKKMAQIAKYSRVSKLLSGTVTTLLFYEPSSRTFGSFGASVKRLGGQTIDILDPKHFSSVSKGETLEDTIRVFEAYSNCLVIRHPVVGSAKAAAEAAFFIPVINAGDGVGEHPTQALLDMYTIFEKRGRLDNLTGVFAGDMLNGRTVHSLLLGLSLFKNNTMYLLSPKELKLTRSDYKSFTDRGIKLIEIEKEQEIPKNAHFWYWTRVQKERFADLKAYEKVKNRYAITKETLENFAGKETILMHPLPRVGEIDIAVDEDPRALYLRAQVRNGMYVRMALLGLILGRIG